MSPGSRYEMTDTCDRAFGDVGVGNPSKLLYCHLKLIMPLSAVARLDVEMFQTWI